MAVQFQMEVQVADGAQGRINAVREGQQKLASWIEVNVRSFCHMLVASNSHVEEIVTPIEAIRIKSELLAADGAARNSNAYMVELRGLTR